MPATLTENLPPLAQSMIASAKAEWESTFDVPVPLLDGCLTSMVSHPGKFLRPVICILSGLAAAHGRVSAAQAQRLVTVASAVEALHTATLLHDDIIDRSSERRNRPAAHVQWGEGIATIAGDLVLARSMRLLSSLGPETHLGATKLVGNMIKGELRQFRKSYYRQKTLREHLAVLRDKTGALFSFCCWAGGMAVDCDALTARRLRRFGRQFGLAFQIADDVLDSIGESPEDTDAGVGIYTLSTNLGVQGSPTVSSSNDTPVVSIESVEFSLHLCDYYQNMAMRTLGGLEESDYRHSLEALTQLPGNQVDMVSLRRVLA